MAAILSGANVNFHSLRYVSERCRIGEKREGMLAVTIPSARGLPRLLSSAGPRMVTEFNYRYADAEQASLFVSVRLTGGDEELGQIIDQLGGNGYPVVNMTESELAKNHVRYMIGGRPARPSVSVSTASSSRSSRGPDALPRDPGLSLEHQPVPLPQPRRRLRFGCSAPSSCRTRTWRLSTTTCTRLATAGKR